MSGAGSKDVTGRTQAPGNTAEPEVCATARASYDHDEFGWLLEQADLLRDGRLDEVDRVSLVEFLTEMARNKKREFRSTVTVLLQHLLKAAVQPEKITRSWLLTIDEHQEEAQSLIEDEPGMRQYLLDLYAKAYPVARRRASIETGIEISRFQVDNPWTMHEALAFLPPAPPPRGRKVMRKG